MTLTAANPAMTFPDTLWITNRRGQRLAILVDHPSDGAKGLIFVQHGSPGYKEQAQLVAIKDIALRHGYIAVRFDCANSFGESEGELIDANVTTHYHDLQDVVAWAKTQPWYQAPFILMGHSMGGITSLLYALDYPQEVKALAPLASALSFEHWFAAMQAHKPHVLQEFAERGWSEKVSDRDPNRKGRWTPAYGEEYKKYDVPNRLSEITAPVLLISGEKDIITPLTQQEAIKDGVSGDVDLHIIPNAPHTFRCSESINAMSKVFEEWIVGIC